MWLDTMIFIVGTNIPNIGIQKELFW